MINKMFISLITLFLVLIFASCKEEGFKLEGKANLVDKCEYAMLFTFDANDRILSVDTTDIKNGTFEFSGKEYLSNYSVVSIGNYPNTVLSAEVILEKGTIKLEMDTAYYKIGGTKFNDLHQSYIDSINLYNEKIIQAFDEGYNDKRKEYVKMRNDFQFNFIKNNILNVVGKKVFMDDLYSFFYDPLCEIMELADDEIKLNKEVLKELDYRKKEEERLKNAEKWRGVEFTDFTLTSVNGKPTKISDLYGDAEYIFIDFWASWCGPCVQDLPNLKELYEKYNDKGFSIIGIAVNDTESAWKKSLKEHDLPWGQLMASSDMSKELKKTYDFNGIPYGILIDKDRKIMAVNLRGQILVHILPQIIN